MKKFLFGVAVGIAIAVGGFFAVNNYIYQAKQTNDINTSGTGVVTEDAHPLLNDSQEQALQNLGIDPTKLPATLTASQEECFIGKLGQARVDEIIAGDTPTALEVLNSSGCLAK
ncbi:MAG: hypothetical protein AAB439_04130 [Patescibacteria group bacterium]